MSQMTLRDIPEDVVDALREEAAERGQSMNAIVRSVLEAHVQEERRRREMEDAMRAADALRKRIEERHGGLLSESWPLIREDRER
jgi:plasmid stability protein